MNAETGFSAARLNIVREEKIEHGSGSSAGSQPASGTSPEKSGGELPRTLHHGIAGADPEPLQAPQGQGDCGQILV